MTSLHIKYEINVNGCWNYLGEINDKGYGRITVKGKKFSAHRYYYESRWGRKIKDGLELDHLCRNRKCVNPEHLEEVEHAENIKRAWKVRIEKSPHCKHGHLLLGKNLYMAIDKKNGKTWRNCKRCKLKANQRWLARKQPANL